MIDISFLLTEDGFFLLQETSSKIVISYGYDLQGKMDGTYTPVARTEG